jgi:type IV secretion system protein VirB10
MTTVTDRGHPQPRNGLDAVAQGEHHAQASYPDLDAGVPVLRGLDRPRINRKALAFLGAIVALLVAAAAWMFHGAAAGPPAGRARGETVVIPQLPATSTSVPAKLTPVAAAAGGVPVPIAVEPVQASAPPPLPPLPEQAMRPASPSAAASPPTLTLMQRRMDTPEPGAQPANPYAQALLAGMPPPPGQAAATTPAVTADASGARFIRHPDALLVRGTYIRCVLETRIVTDIPGFTSCVVTEPTYSIDGRNLLLPKGSKVSGRYDTDASGPRVAVVWDRITTPDGVDVDMASPGVDNLGGAGHPGDYDAHWGARIGAALMISMISDAFKYEGEQHGPRTTTVSNGLVTQAPFDSNTARTMQRLANQALDRSSSRPATVTINQGTVLNIYVATDVDFAAVVTAR